MPCAPQKLDSARPELVTRLLAGCGIVAALIVLLRIVLRLLADLAGLIALSVRPLRAIEAENLVLRRQLALFKERA